MKQSSAPEGHRSSFSSPEAVRAYLTGQQRRHELVGTVRVGVATDVRELTIGSLPGSGQSEREQE